MSMINSYTVRDRKEAGMVAIMVTLILMIVISLIVLGFAQISRRNQRQALDRQLSTQAFYAAETGVNDVTDLINQAAQSGQAVSPKTDCDPASGVFYSTLDPVLDPDSNVEYTCLLVDPTPADLVYSSVGTTSTVVPLIATGGTIISSVELTWQSKDGSSTPDSTCPSNGATANIFPPTGSWSCGYGVLRYDLVPTAGSLSTAGLLSSTMTSFVIPLRSTGTNPTSNPISYPTPPTPVNGANNRLAVICSSTSCSLTISGLNQNQYYMRVSSIYKDVSLQIRALDGSGNPIRLQGAQAVVDVTGKAQDVLRRIQVRVPLPSSSTNLLSDYAIQSTEAICKRFSVMDGFFDNSADNAVSGVANLPTSADNRLCRP